MYVCIRILEASLSATPLRQDRYSDQEGLSEISYHAPKRCEINGRQSNSHADSERERCGGGMHAMRLHLFLSDSRRTDGRTDVVLSLVQSVLPLRYLIEIWERDKTAAVTAIH